MVTRLRWPASLEWLSWNGRLHSATRLFGTFMLDATGINPDRKISSDNQLSVIHVAGTKGKGSTCAFANSFLTAHGRRAGFPRKIGLYTSPHLTRTRERIRINFVPISEELFARYFFEVWEKLSSAAVQHSRPMPGYLQILMLMSVHTFIQEKVDVAIYETHSGGEFCSTNILEPIVTGVTTLGLDHTDVLGPRIENIAWHKAGIFKTGIAAFSSPQEPAAAKVLQQRASERNVHLKFTTNNLILPAKATELEPEVQRVNASLAIALTTEFLRIQAPSASLNSQDIIAGLDQYSWPGRFELIVDGNRHWFLDVAHNEMSLKVSTDWFVRKAWMTEHSMPSILIFSHYSFRDGAGLLSCIASSVREASLNLQHIIFTPVGKEGRDAFLLSNGTWHVLFIH